MRRSRVINKMLLLGVLAIGLLATGTQAQAEQRKSHLFPAGYCTWYVADRNDFYVVYINFHGNAGDWIGNAQANGYKTKDRNWKPNKYSVVVLNTSNPERHVALVKKVESKRFLITEMNYIGWNRVSERWISKGDSGIKGFILSKKAIEQYEAGNKDEYKKLKKQYQKHDIWYDGRRQ